SSAPLPAKHTSDRPPDPAGPRRVTRFRVYSRHGSPSRANVAGGDRAQTAPLAEALAAGIREAAWRASADGQRLGDGAVCAAGRIGPDPGHRGRARGGLLRRPGAARRAPDRRRRAAVVTVLLRAPEAFVAWLWQRQVGRSLCARDGQQVHVIYPGRRYGSWGPDFRGAVVTIDGRVERGDVEVHTRSGGWVQHGHGADPVYGGTVLHVVLHLDARQGAVTANGRGIPEVALADQYPAGWLRAELGRWQSGAAPVAVHACLSPAEAAELLDRAGRARIEAKSARLEADIAIVGEEQALWAGVLGALGYSASSSPFRLLADRIGVHEAEFTARCDPLLLDALLFGEAGLLPSQRGVGVGADAYARAIERAWAEARRSGPRRGLGWRWVGVRPVNHPARRVAAAAALAADVARWPLDRHVRALLTERAPGKAAAGLDALLLRTGE